MNKSLGQVVEKILDEGKQLFGIVLYFWLLIGIFTVFKSLVLNDQNLIFHNGFAIINAWILAKVVLVAEHLKTAENLRHKPLIYPIIFKAAVFCMLLMGFYIGEEILVGIWRGRTIVESFPEVGGGSWKGIVVVSLILFVGLIPFFFRTANSPERLAKTSCTHFCFGMEQSLRGGDVRIQTSTELTAQMTAPDRQSVTHRQIHLLQCRSSLSGSSRHFAVWSLSEVCGHRDALAARRLGRL